MNRSMAIDNLHTSGSAKKVAGIVLALICLWGKTCPGKDAERVLANLEASTQPWASCAFQAECLYNVTYSTRPAQVYLERCLFDTRYDAGRFDIATTYWSHWQGKSGARGILSDGIGASSTRDIWDGHTYYSYTQIPSENSYHLSISSPSGSLNANLKRAAHNRIVESPNCPLLGIFEGDSVPFFDILGRLPAGAVDCNDALLDGAHCKLIEAKTSSGTYEVWIAPGSGFCVLKAVVRKARGDRYYEDTMGAPVPAEIAQLLKANEFPSSSLVASTFELDHVNVEKRNGIWIVISAEWATTEKYAGGEASVRRVGYRLIKTDFAPDLGKIGAFAPTFHDGTEVHIEGQGAAIPLRWHDGHVEPAVDEATRARLDKEVQDALKDGGLQ